MSTPFQFGAGAIPQFTGVSTAQQMSVDAGVQQQLAALRDDLAALRGENVAARNALAEARAANARIGGELTCALAGRDAALKKEAIARRIFVTKSKMAHTTEEWEEGVRLQGEINRLDDLVKEERKTLSKAALELDHTKGQLNTSNKELEDKQTQLENIQTSVDKLRKDLEHEKAATAHAESTITALYADLEQSNAARKAAIKARDDALVGQKETELEFKDLSQQWNEAQSRIHELEEQLQEVQRLDEQQVGLQDDLDNLRNHLHERERTLIVKDERISHLESQFQKERERNLHAADAAASEAASRVASPIHEAPQLFPTIADSLQDELAAASEYEESIYEPIEISAITEIADIAPIEPAFTPLSVVDVRETASVAPIDAEAPVLTVNFGEAASVSPIERQIPTATTSTQTDAHELAIEVLEHATVDIAPIAPTEVDSVATSTQTDAHDLTTQILEHATFAIAPIARTEIDTVATFTQTDAHELTTEVLEYATVDITPIAPIEIDTVTNSTQTEAPKLTTNLIDTATITVTPVEALETERKLTANSAVQTAMLEPKNKITPVMVTHEERPLVHTRPTASALVQTVETLGTTERAPPVVISPASHGMSAFQWVLSIIAILLALLCSYLYTELQAWRTANGVGFGYGYGNMADRSGAYGNGRYLFGVFPIAMDVGNSWLSEEIARHMSMAITCFENWAGISYTPLY